MAQLKLKDTAPRPRTLIALDGTTYGPFTPGGSAITVPDSVAHDALGADATTWELVSGMPGPGGEPTPEYERLERERDSGKFYANGRRGRSEVSLSVESTVVLPQIEPGPASVLPVATDKEFPTVPAAGWTNTAASGSDTDGAFVTMSDASNVTTSRIDVTPGHTHLLKIRAAGALPNGVQINWLSAAGGYLSNSFAYFFTSSGSFAPPVAADARTLSKTIAVPNDSRIAKAEFIFQKRAAHATNPARFYGWFTADTQTLPRLPKYKLPLSYRGIGLQGLFKKLGWISDSGVTLTQVRDYLTTYRDLFALKPGETIRLFLNADAGMTISGGVPTGFTARTWTNLGYVMTVLGELGLKVVPVLYYPMPFSSTTRGFDRTAMLNPTLAAAYRTRTTELCEWLDDQEPVAAIDLINEFTWALDHAEGQAVGTYSAQQIADCFENISAGARAGTKKLLIASCATGKEVPAVAAFIDYDSFDIWSLHSYNSVVSFYVPHMGKPIIAGEYGPDVTDNVQPQQEVLDQTIHVMQALPSRVSAAWMWSEKALAPQTDGSLTIINQPLLDVFNAFHPAEDLRRDAWASKLTDLADVDPSGLVAGQSLVVQADGRFKAARPVSPYALTAGQATLNRLTPMVNTGTGLTVTNGSLPLTFYCATKTEKLSNLAALVGTAAAGATTSQLAVFAVDWAAMTATRIGLGDRSFTSANTRAAVTLATPFDLIEGQWYAFAPFVLGATTSPIFAGINIAASISAESASPPRLCGRLSGLTEVPSTIDLNTISDWTSYFYMRAY